MGNHNQFLKIKETLEGYMWTMNTIIQNDGVRLRMFDRFSKNIHKIDEYMCNIYVQFQTHPDGTLTFHIKKKTK